MIRVNLYKKLNTYYNLLVGTPEEEKINMPLYNTDITLWKGVDNNIEFSIRNHDRKSVAFADGVVLKFVAIHQPLNQKIEKELEPINVALGRYKISLTKEELKDFDCGTFIGHVSIGDDEELLYSGTDWYPYFNVEIKPNKMELIDESTTLLGETFNREIVLDMGREMEYFTSPIFKADKSPFHTMTAKLNKFNGIVKLQGSTMETPGLGDSEWFDIYVKEYLCEKKEEDNNQEPSEPTLPENPNDGEITPDLPNEEEPSEPNIPSDDHECPCTEDGGVCECEDCPYDDTPENTDEFYVDGESYSLEELYEEKLPEDDGDCPFVTIVDEESGQTYILPKNERPSKPHKPNDNIDKPMDKPYHPHNNHHNHFPFPYHNYHPYLVFGSEDYKHHCHCHKPHHPHKPIHKPIHKCEPFTGTEVYNGRLNCLWVRLQYIRPMDSESSIDEITYRN